jgi:hypothetical protein
MPEHAESLGIVRQTVRVPTYSSPMIRTWREDSNVRRKNDKSSLTYQRTERSIMCLTLQSKRLGQSWQFCILFVTRFVNTKVTEFVKLWIRIEGKVSKTSEYEIYFYDRNLCLPGIWLPQTSTWQNNPCHQSRYFGSNSTDEWELEKCLTCLAQARQLVTKAQIPLNISRSDSCYATSTKIPKCNSQSDKSRLHC